MGQEPLGTRHRGLVVPLLVSLSCQWSTGHRGPGPIDPAWAWPLLPEVLRSA